MGSRISGAGFGNRWKFGRLTEGTIQGRKKKLTGKFLLSRLNKKKKKIVTNWEKFQHDCVGYKVDVRQTL